MFDMYGLDQVSLYENQIIGTLPPHLFAIGKYTENLIDINNIRENIRTLENTILHVKVLFQLFRS